MGYFAISAVAVKRFASRPDADFVIVFHHRITAAVTPVGLVINFHARQIAVDRNRDIGVARGGDNVYVGVIAHQVRADDLPKPGIVAGINVNVDHLFAVSAAAAEFRIGQRFGCGQAGGQCSQSQCGEHISFEFGHRVSPC